MTTVAPLALGLMTVDDVLLALPVAMLREVIPCPDALAPLPLPGVCGAVQLRGLVIPVLDLRAALGLPGAGTPGKVIVLMRHAGRLLGLRVGAVNGMARVAASGLHALDAVNPCGAGIVTHSFEVEGRVAALLDAARIAGLPGVPMVAEPVAQAGADAAAAREPLLLFRCGALHLGIASLQVDATVPRTTLRDNPLVGGLCRGVIAHHGVDVPVIDTLALLGLGRLAAGGQSQVAVLRLPQGPLGLMLDDVRDIVRVAPRDILALPAVGLGRPEMLRGMLVADDGLQHLLVDAAAIAGDALLASLAGMSRAEKTASVRTQAVARRSFITYRIEVETASAMDQVGEILGYPERLLALDGGQALGLFDHRGEAVPLICLGTLLGRPTTLDPVSARVLLVGEVGARVGFAVQALCSIETACWEQPARPGDERGSATVRRMLPLVEVGAEGARRSLPRLDLLQLVNALRGEPRVPAAPAGAGLIAAR
jgi:purine-binding chemotaxis protein CheW